MSKKENLLEKSPKLSVPEIIDYSKNVLGITFNLMDEQTAADFLAKHNYFFRLKQYANFAEKTKSGKYVGVDFGQLVELSTIDMFFRKIMLKMTIDFEHYLKVKLINESQQNDADDGYLVVKKFLETHKRVQSSIENITSASATFYNREAYDKYKQNLSIWAFVEIIGFSDFIDFYAHYYEFFHLKCEYTKHFDAVRRLRNAAAHNAPMLSSFNPVSWFHSDIEIQFELLSANLGIGQGTITSCLKIPAVNDFAVMLSNYSKLISSPKIKQKTYEELISFFDNRMIYRKQYFEGITNIKNVYQVSRKILEYYSQK